MELSIEMKKLLLLALPRITTMEIRITVERNRYLDVIDELENFQRALQEEVLQARDQPSKNGL